MREILRRQLDRGAVRRPLGRVLPAVAVTLERLGIGQPPLVDHALKRAQPVLLVGLAAVRVARALDLLNEDRAPLGPAEGALTNAIVRAGDRRRTDAARRTLF